MTCILGIETSCDDTCVAVYDTNNGVIFNQVYSQSQLYNYYGGIVPEFSARKHLEILIVLLKNIFKKGKISKNLIDAVAYTAGPGLVGSLLVGASVGTALAYSLKVPVVLVNHMEAHLLTPMLENIKPTFPFLALLVSGGHTQLINALGIGEYELLGETLDDAVGEAFDKVAQALGLGYPGGSNLSKLARSGIPGTFNFPRPMINNSNLNFSFSGLKTFVLNIIQKNNNDFQIKANIAREFENAVVDSLVIKCIRALKKLKYTTLVVSGGVSKNDVLRMHINRIIKQYNYKVFYSHLKYCSDNAAMIAYVGSIRYKKFKSLNLEIKINPNWSIVDLAKI
ncbi:putative O-sialoglycoprotein endopeptidase [Buchnera aphidicola str. Bp (Baizongia pistaciae)]|uniref:tRNA N6-adenosine threonylcarbamoyltransferase n=1 Tax=Buchnera aphidicola subsp. Baizongia pistaciae (strain Bp) TaxID=224915 RepID=TSAD_BUCBP|nr:tRNA (adenosine(37)-N6)-threonylcarbamoyltransferase complex transferase subunit TsaD [Buchnera aphidicola]Q89B07.1 RecName: Full=tRNA N6-adenosine threonylcarbamoyltransferase; AltName: Full=N6-L-threonylcarbamoyladenine synthase; Short=t(6)A synthase; AltName: Full=t(6)A37 threonylcarbamoyladenosine biosynthesis protein TsaD; AltName: Full=tRNA threonylcarbamoyladenosine biosynthesis protein TsaD [Buchnera aphidicola str. Bp (Baizongia pistaciae)]AAO26794.1 putative O-sialoglycoprotein endop